MPSREQPGACCTTKPIRKGLPVFPGYFASATIQIRVSPLYCPSRLRSLHLQEPPDVCSFSAGRLPRPQVYVKQHSTPAGDLSFQPDLQGMLLAENESLKNHFPRLRARRPAEKVVDLAAGPLLCIV